MCLHLESSLDRATTNWRKLEVYNISRMVDGFVNKVVLWRNMIEGLPLSPEYWPLTYYNMSWQMRIRIRDIRYVVHLILQYQFSQKKKFKF